MKTLENLAIVQRHNDNNLCQHVTKVNRVCFVDRKRAKTSVSCPKVVSMYVCMYDRNMGGVDRLDENEHRQRVSFYVKKMMEPIIRYLADWKCM